MNLLLSIFGSLFLFSTPLVCRAEIAFNDIVFEKAPADEAESRDDYEEPFLVVQSFQRYPSPPKKIQEEIRKKLNQGQISESSVLKGEYQLPKDLLEKGQWESIQSCSSEKCQVKLNKRMEIPRLERSKNKGETYAQLIAQRIQNYLKKKELVGYEDRDNNQTYIKKMISLVPSLKDTPKVVKFMAGAFWKNEKKESTLKKSWLKQQMVVIASDRMQPILRISEDLEFEENQKTLFLDLPVYSNHYFDSSLTFYELMGNAKFPNQTLVVVTDVMEIDELKKSALIRALFKGQMVKAVTTSQKAFLDALVDGGVK